MKVRSLTGLKSRVSRAVWFLETVGENLFPCPFQLLEVTCIPWLVAPSSILRVRRPASSNLLTLTLLPPSHKDSVITPGYPGGSCVTSPAQGPQLNPMATIPLPRTVTHSQVLGIRTQTRWGLALSHHTEEQHAEASQAPSSSRQPGTHSSP